MSVKNFVPEIWAANFLEALDRVLVFEQVCNTDYEGEIKGYGDTVHITEVGEITISNYAPGVTTVSRQQLNVAAQVLTIDQSKYWAFEIDDVDRAQARSGGALMNEAMRKAAQAMRQTIDTDLAGLYSQAGISITTAGSTAVNAGNIIGLMTYASQLLSEADAPAEGRWMVVSPWFGACLLRAKALRDTDNSEILNRGWTGNGLLGDCMGFTVFQSNAITTTGTFPSYTSYVTFGTKRAISFAKQVVKTEAFRPEGSFADAVKGLTVWGRKVVDPTVLGSITAVHTTETNI